jgi:hypothetical protein
MRARACATTRARVCTPACPSGSSLLLPLLSTTAPWPWPCHLCKPAGETHMMMVCSQGSTCAQSRHVRSAGVVGGTRPGQETRSQAPPESSTRSCHSPPAPQPGSQWLPEGFAMHVRRGNRPPCARDGVQPPLEPFVSEPQECRKRSPQPRARRRVPQANAVRCLHALELAPCHHERTAPAGDGEVPPWAPIPGPDRCLRSHSTRLLAPRPFQVLAWCPWRAPLNARVRRRRAR